MPPTALELWRVAELRTPTAGALARWAAGDSSRALGLWRAAESQPISPATFNQQHPRGAHGRFRKVSFRVMDDLDKWLKGPDGGSSSHGSVALNGYSQPQLRVAAVQLGLNPAKGTKRGQLELMLIAHARTQHSGGGSSPHAAAGLPSAPPVPTPARKKVSAPAAMKAAHDDGLEALDDRDLRDLAVENGLSVPRLDQISKRRDGIIADLRAAGVVSPMVSAARIKATEDIEEHLFQIGRRKPTNTAPFEATVRAIGTGADGKAAALEMRRAAVASKASMSAEDLRTYQLLATRLGAKKTRPAWINDDGNVILDQLVHEQAPAVDLSPVENPAVREWTEGKAKSYPPDTPAWVVGFEYTRNELQKGTITRAAAVKKLNEYLQGLERGMQRARDKDAYWRKSHDRSAWAVRTFKPTAYEQMVLAKAAAAVDAYRGAIAALQTAKIPSKPRAKSLAPTELGEVLPIDESRFSDVSMHQALAVRGEQLDPGFKLRGPNGTGGVMFLFAPGVVRPHRDGLTKAESDAADYYTVGRVARALNGSLRKGRNAHGEVTFPEIGLNDPIDLDQMRADLDSAIEAGELNTDTVLWRGVLLKKADQDRLVPGAILSDAAYSSTTTKERDADKVIRHWSSAGLYKGTKPAKFKILAAAGTHGVVGHESVSEILLGRDQKFRVVREEPPGKDGVPVFVLEAIAPEADKVAGTDITATFDYSALPKPSGLSGSIAESAQRAIYEQQGFDGPPTVATADELDQAIRRRGAVELFRGIKPSGQGAWAAPTSSPKSAEEIAEQFRSGSVHYGATGGAVYGRGTYAAPDRKFADQYAASDGSLVLRMALRRDARVIHYDDVRKLHLKAMPRAMRELDEKQKLELDAVDRSNPAAVQAILDKYAKLRASSSIRSQAISDLGNFAAMLGYDAIVVPVQYRGLKGKGSPTEYVILNRTALLVQEAPK